MKRLEIGGCLNAAELLSICTLLEITRRAKAYSEKTATICRLTPWMYFLRDWNR